MSTAADTDAYDMNEDSNHMTSSEIEHNFVKAVSLSSLIHPVHEIQSPSPPPRGNIAASTSLLDVIGTQTLLMEACEVLSLSILDFQRLYV